MHKCSVGFILYLKCGAGKKDIFMKIDIDELLICRVELVQTRLKIRTLADVFDLCPNHKLQFTENIHMNIITSVSILSPCISK